MSGGAKAKGGTPPGQHAPARARAPHKAPSSKAAPAQPDQVKPTGPAPAKSPASKSAAAAKRTTPSARALPIRSSPVSTAPSLRSKLATLKTPAKPAARTPAPARAKPKALPFARNPVLQELEPRLLMSADLNPLSGDALTATPALAGAEFRNIADTGTPTIVTTGAVAPIQRTNELVFVDTAVPDYQKLVDEMRTAALAEGRNLEFVLIDADKDGVRRITDTLAQRSDLDAVHIISHGESGSLRLGATTLDFDALVKRATAIKRWGDALTENGDILIYGCDLAATQEGRSLVDALARLTGADVAASDDPTGSAKQGGDWDLEFRNGTIETAVAVGADADADWEGTLAAVAVTGTTDVADGNTTSIANLIATPGADGFISLREAITAANNTAGLDTITFSIGGGPGVKTINVGAIALPSITDAVVLDATTQAGWAVGSLMVEINGAGVADRAGIVDPGLHLAAGSDGSTIRGFTINRFGVGADFGDQAGIFVQSTGNTIAGNWLGTTSSGLADGGGGQDYGVLVNGNGNTVGGLTAAGRNVISANDIDGLRIVAGDNNVVIGNWIGLNKDGNAELGNNIEGIHLRNSADYNTIGGTAPGARNVVSGNSGGGIRISGSGTTPPVGNLVQGNYFGTDPGGTFALGAVGSGFNAVEIDNGASNNTIGGVNAGEGNIVAFSWDDNIEVYDQGQHSTGNAFLGNLNFSAETDGGGDGSGIDLNTPTDVFANHEATANDLGDADGGLNAPNELQNAPAITGAVSDGSWIRISGQFGAVNNSRTLANTNYRIEFFSSPNYTAMGAGYREGAVYLGAVDVTTDASGNFTFDVALNTPVAVGRYITATATRANANFTQFFETSEFSQDDEAVVAAGAGARITGRLLEDVDGDADVAEAGTRAISGATVRLYRDLGTAGTLEAAATDTPVTTVTTDANGNYAFLGLANGTYWVAVDSKTIAPSAGFNAGSTIANVWAEQTYGTAQSVTSNAGATLGAAGAFYGGKVATQSDDASAASTAEHVFRATIAGGVDVTGLNAGFSFNSVVNVRGTQADDDGAGTARHSQGTLDQFILNANAIAGGNTMRFVPAVATNAGAGATSRWRIDVSAALPQITDQFTVIDGTAYNAAVNGTVRDTNTATLGYVGRVGLGADLIANTADDPTLAGVAAPELEIMETAAAQINVGLDIQASNVTVRRVSIHGFGADNTLTANLFAEADIRVGVAGAGDTGSAFTGVVIEDNVIGTTSAADVTTDPGASNRSVNGILVAGPDNGIIQRNVIGWAGRFGAFVTNNAEGWLIQSNDFRDNAVENTQQDGLDLGNRTGTATVTGNYFFHNRGGGVDGYRGDGGNLIENNTFEQNGGGPPLSEPAQIRLYGTGSTVRYNLIQNGFGPGVLVVRNDGTTNTPATGNLISRNSFNNNAGIAIDLNGAAGNNSLGDGISLNDGATSATAGNTGIDYPVVATASKAGATTTISGTAAAGVTSVEVYRAAGAANDQAGGSTYGEGVQYLGTAAVVAGAWTLSFTDGAVTLNVGDAVSAIGITAASNTSEFSSNSTVAAAPVAVNDAYTVLQNGTLTVGWWDTAWSRREQITFNNNFAGSGNLTDFPVLIALDSTKIDYAQVQNSGQDLRFIASDGTPLAYEIETWNESGTSYVWVKVPSIAAASTTGYIWMYYGNASASAGQTPAAVWSGNGYNAVYHLDDAGVLVDDSSSFNIDGTAVNGPVTSAAVISNGRTFDGNNDLVNLGTNRPLLVGAAAATLSAWVLPDDAVTSSFDSVNDVPIISVGRNNGGTSTLNSRASLEQKNGNVWVSARSTDDSTDLAVVATTTNPLTTGVWHYVEAVIDYANDTITIYVDGVAQATAVQPQSSGPTVNFTNAATPNTNSENAALADQDDASLSNNPGWDGQLDEVRIASAARSAGWVKASYENQRSGGTFVSIGAAQTAPALEGVLGTDTDPGNNPLTAVLVTGPANGTLSLNKDGTFVYTPTPGFTGTDTFTYYATNGTGSSSPATVTITVAVPRLISGSLHNDLNANGDVTDDGGAAFAGATVHLYADNGDGVIGAGDTLTATTTTDASGAYSFTVPAGSYYVVVDSKTLAAPGYNGGFTIADVWAEQTYAVAGASSNAAGTAFTGSAGALYGGRAATASDNASALATAEHVTKVVVGASNVAGIDSGFSFSAIVDAQGDAADDDVSANRIQQGTLRQFILNSNAISGTQTSNFSINFAGGGGAQTLNVSTVLPDVVDTVILDATTQEGWAGAPIIELNGTGTVVPNDSGLTIVASNSVVRGFAITRFGDAGITLKGNNNVVVGNYLGLTAAGGAAGNNRDGITVYQFAANNTIGGTGANDRNVISGNLDDGISIDGATGTVVIGNHVGLNTAGTGVIGNGGDGVVIQLGLAVTPATNNTVGGTTAAERNVIAGNATNAANGLSNVRIRGAGTTGNVVLGNYIGTNAAGTLALSNPGYAVLIGEAATNSTIGGTANGSGNLVTGTNGDGVVVTDTATGHAILGNRIFGNGGLGIDLADDGVTANDPTDADAGPNARQNYPVITSFSAGAGVFTIAGTLQSTAGGSFRIEFFGNDLFETGGYYEGQRYLNYLEVTDNGVNDLDPANGTIRFSATLAGTLGATDVITATATRANAAFNQLFETSEFSPTGVLIVDTTADTVDGTVTSILNLIANKGADGRISLREAILATNATTNYGTPDRILFNIDNGAFPLVGGAHTINVGATGLGELPSITDAVLLDATTEPDFAGTPVIQLNGTSATGDADGLTVSGAGAAGTTIRGFVINRFNDNGILITNTSGVVVQGNYVGTNVAGTAASSNNRDGGTDGDGIRLMDATGNTIGGTTAAQRNVVSGNDSTIASSWEHGIYLWNADNNLIQGNYLGTNAAGTAAIRNFADGVGMDGGSTGNTIRGNLISGNKEYGIWASSNSGGQIIQGNLIGTNFDGTTFVRNGIGAVSSPNPGAGIRLDSFANTIGGTLAGQGNVISGNQGAGIALPDANSDSNVIQGNYIGTTANGLAALANAGAGVDIGAGAANNTIGGTAVGARNVISGNSGDGVRIFGPGATGNLVQGNYVGTDVNGTADLGNTSSGVFISGGASSNTVGGGVAAAGNVLSGNDRYGVELSGGATTGNVIQANRIGTMADGTTPRGNAMAGVSVGGGANGNVIGLGYLAGAETGLGNTIAYNGGDGVEVSFPAPATQGNRIAGNSIYSNGSLTGDLGIDLGANGNGFGSGSQPDAGDGDVGPNGYQNYPEFITTALNPTGATTNGTTLTVSGRLLTNAAIQTFRLHFYANSGPTAEGQRYLGYWDLVNPAATQFFNATVTAFVADGEYITMTATRIAGGVSDTSEFSPAVQARSVQTISGAIYNDDEGDGAIAGDAGFVGATVKLYRDSGNNAPDGTDTFIATATTGAGGTYSFTNVVSGYTYWVVVDSKTLDAASIAGTVWADQTYGDDSTTAALDVAARYGGRNVSISDNAWDVSNVLQAPEHVSRVVLGTADVAGVDSAFSFVSVSNNRGDATDDDEPVNPGTARLQQGSLRQVILNANAIAGTQTVNFSVGTGQVAIDASAGGYTIDGTLVLDATTQEGFAGTPLVLIDGNGAGGDGFTLTTNADGSTIRGFIIRNFGSDAIEILAGSDNNLIAGNYLGGLTFAGADAGLAERNISAGIRISGSGNTVGGTTAADANVISRNADGVFVNAGNANVVIGNYIGTNAAGNAVVTNTDDGVQVNRTAVNNPTNTRIGGTAAGEGNVIAGSGNNGIELTASGATGSGVTIQGNWIGTDRTSTLNLGNGAVSGSGIYVNTWNAVTVGGTAATAGNTIANNGGDGVEAGLNDQVTILRNSIYANGATVLELGIDLSSNGATANDPGNPDALPQNFPVIAAVRLVGATVEIDYSLDSDVSQAYRIEFFSNPSTDPNEGRTFLGAASITTNASGLWSSTLTLSPTVLPVLGDRVTATATRDLGGGNYSYTSEFSSPAIVSIPPVNTVPGAQTVAEDTALAFTGGNTISVTDADGNVATTQLTVANGVLNVSLVGGASISAGANNSATMTIAGTQAQINAALATLTYQGTLNFNGADTLTVLSTDALGGADSDAVAITVTAVNDNPVVGNLNGDSLAYSEGAGAVVIDQGAGATVTDVDSANFDTGTLTVSFTAGSDSAEDVLAIRNQGVAVGQIGVAGANVTYNFGAGAVVIGTFAGGSGGANLVVTFNANATPAAAQALIRNITYQNTDTNAPTTGARTVQFVLTDGDGGTSVAANATVTVSGVNDAPTATITPLTYAATEQVNLTLHGTGLSVADVDAGAASVTATLSVGTGILTVGAGTNVVTVNNSGTASVTLTGAIAEINSLLAGNNGGSAVYNANTDTPPASTILTLAIDDGGNTGSGGPLNGSDTATINITAVNDGPTATITPLTYAATEQVNLTLHATGLSVADVDAGAASVTATLSVGAGILTVGAGTTGVTVGGSGTGTVTLTGTLAQINNLLAGNLSATVAYNANTDTPPASTTLTLSIDDGGNTGGGALVGSDTAIINITAVNDAPVAADVSASGAEDAASIAITLTASDVDGTIANFRLTNLPANGTLYTDAGLTTPAATATNYVAAANALTLYFRPNANWNGATTFQYTAIDDLGLADASDATATITVTAVNDAPANTVPGAQTVASGATLVLSGASAISIADVDAGATVQVTLNATNGTVSLSGLAGLAFSVGDGTADATMTFTGTIAAINTALNGLGFTPAAGYVGAGAALQIVTNDLGGTGAPGALSDTDSVAITVTGFDISGTIFHDVDGDADVAEGGTLLFANATVHLYADDGDGVIDGGDGWVATMSTNGLGQYTFLNRAAGTYWVIVDSTSLNSGAGFNGPYDATWIWAEQTYGVTGGAQGAGFLGASGALYGGRSAIASDDATAVTSAEHVTRVTLAGANATGVDSGFSFNAVVNTVDDAAGVPGNRTVQGSLRQFIQNANAITNASYGIQSSNFSISTGVQTIAVTSVLPTITESVVLDATTQEGVNPVTGTNNPMIELNGTGAGAAGDGLVVNASGSTIRGFIINRFGDDGIVLQAGGNVVLGNWIGLGTDGVTDRGNGDEGVYVTSANNTIGGLGAGERNVISGNQDDGVDIEGAAATGNVVRGNYTGTNWNGTVAVGNTWDGVIVWNGAGGNTIDANLISGNVFHGVEITGAGGEVITGNLIGTNAAGTGDLGNGRNGIRVTGAPSVTIGGALAAERNVISGNAREGIVLDNADDALVRGNRIGTNAAGTAAIANDWQGIQLWGGTSGAVIQDNLISGNLLAGIRADGATTAANVIRGNFIGTDVTGTVAIGNGSATTEGGILLNAGAGGFTIGGTTAAERNVISGNTGAGITLNAGGSGTTITGNYIGTDVTGTIDLGNTTVGVTVRGSANNVIGGATAAERNVISGNDTDGVSVQQAGADNNLVQGNYVGLRADGNAMLGNGGDGIDVDNGATNTRVIGNVVAASGADGIEVTDPTTIGTVIRGNYIGTDRTGTLDFGNGGHGIFLDTAGATIVGGTVAGQGNLISGNTGSGIRVSASSGNAIQGNIIGRTAGGGAALGNSGDGIRLEGVSQNNLIGGILEVDALAGNVIASNGGDGIVVTGPAFSPTADFNRILGNLIFQNGELGIDIGDDGVTANDAGDVDSGPNSRKNYADITSVQTDGVGQVTISGAYNGSANAGFRVEFFVTDGSAGNGEGQRYLGATTFTTDGSGNATFTVTLFVTVGLGESVTSVATDTTSNRSSEFSGNVAAVPYDVTPPAAPDVVDIVTNNVQPVITGTYDSADAAGGFTVTVDGVTYTLGVDLALTAVGDNWTLNLATAGQTLAEGSYDVVATATDGVGNSAADVDVLDVVIDTTAPAAPVVNAITIDTGIPADEITSDQTLIFGGTSEANATVTVYLNAVLIGATTANGAGSWSFDYTTTTLADGAYSVTATATDAAGNTSVLSAALPVVVDTSAPAAPSAPDLVAASDSGYLANDDATNDTTPSFSGTAEAGATVSVYDGAGLLGTTVADGAGNWSFTSGVLGAGSHTLSATATDAAGNTSAASAPLTITIDTTAPTLASAVVNGATLTLSYSETLGAIVPGAGDFTVNVNAAPVAINAVNVVGATVVITLAAPVTNVDVVSVSYAAGATPTQDVAGNLAANLVGQAVTNTTADTFAPATPLSVDLLAASDTGASSIDDLTNDTTPTVRVTLDPGSGAAALVAGDTVRVYSGVTLVGSIVLGAADLTTGYVDVTLAGLGADGVKNLTATVTDAAANASGASPALPITLDTTAPAPTVTLDPNVTADDVINAAEALATIAITGTAGGAAQVGDTVSLTINGTVYTGTVAAGGTFSINVAGSDLALDADRTIDASITSTDLAGNSGLAADTEGYTVDTATPAAPSSPDLIATSDSGASSTDNVTSDTTPTFSGTAEAGATVSVYDGAGLLGTTVADGAGNWSFTSPALADGAHSISATATDAAGNTSPASAPLAITIDTTAPAAPAVTTFTNDSGTPGDGITSDSTLVFGGTAEPNSTVTVYVNAAPVGTATADGAGNWTFDYTGTPLADGAYGVTATATDAAGNVSAPSAALAVTVDTGAPAQPATPDLAAASDSGISSTDDLTNDTTPSFSGTAEAGATVSVYDGAGLLGTTVADGAGNWSFTSPALADGAHSISVTATDAAGNTSVASPPLAITVDTAAPTLASFTSSTAAGTYGVGAVIDITATLSEPVAAGSQITVTLDTGDLVVLTAAANGTTLAGSYTVGAGDNSADLDVASFVVNAVQDLAGNPMSSTAIPGGQNLADNEAIVVDTTAPAQPGAPDLDPASDTGASNADDVTSDTTPTFNGSGAEPGSTVTIVSSIDGVLGTTIADALGNWTFTPPAPLSDGNHTITVTSTDGVGNVTPASPPLAITIDSTAPAAPTVDNITSPTALPVLTGTATLAAGETLTVTVNGATYAVTPDAFGNWTLDVGVAVPASGVLGAFLDNNTYPVTATVTDTAGNTTVTIGAVTIDINDVPVTVVPGAQAGFEDVWLAIAGITVSDLDGDPLDVTLSVASGTLQLTLVGSATISAGAIGSGTLTVSGSIADLNATLATLGYRGAQDWSGADTLTVATSDGALVDTDNIAITLAAVNDSPVLGANAFAIGANGTLVLSGANLSATDVDTLVSSLLFSVTGVTSGRFEFVSSPGVAIASFTQADVQAGLVRFVHDGSGAPSFSIYVSDGGAQIGPFAANIAFTPNGGFVVAPTVAGSGTGGGGAPAFLPTAVSAPQGATPPAGATTFLRGPTEPPPGGGDNDDVEAAPPPAGVVTRVAAGTVLQDKVLIPEGQSPGVRVEGEVIETKPLRSEIQVEPMRAEMEVLPVGDKDALDLNEEDRQVIDIVLSSVRITGLALSVGAVWWAARAAGLLASVLTAAPAWRHVDPLPVLGRDVEEEEESDVTDEDKDRRDDEHRARWVLDDRAAGA